MKAKAPNGKEITGTLEVCQANANISKFWRENGELKFEYSGETVMFWDEQKSVTRNGGFVFLDEDGGEWLESEIILYE